MVATIINGNAIDVLKSMQENSIDAVVSDPPYQLTGTSGGLHLGSYGKFQRLSRGFMGKEWDILPSTDTLKECLKVLKPGAFALWLMTPRQDSQLEFLLRLREAGFVISFTPLYWVYASGFPKAENISKAINKKKLEYNTEALKGAYAGFQPKPAVEVIIVTMKPLSEKTYISQAMKNGKGVTWLDNARIPIINEKVIIHGSPLDSMFAGGEQDRLSFKNYRSNLAGRFPANLLASDNILDASKNESDGNDLSRYFSLDAWWEGEIKELPEFQQKTFPFLYVPKASRNEKNKGLVGVLPEKPIDFDSQTRTNKETADKFGAERKAKMQNHHPTVKPIKLISYLVTLVTKENDTVLDPFMGSGTTLVASALLNRNAIGIEIDKEYASIAKNRLNFYNKNNKISVLDNFT